MSIRDCMNDGHVALIMESMTSMLKWARDAQFPELEDALTCALLAVLTGQEKEWLDMTDEFIHLVVDKPSLVKNVNFAMMHTRSEGPRTVLEECEEGTMSTAEFLRAMRLKDKHKSN